MRQQMDLATYIYINSFLSLREIEQILRQALPGCKDAGLLAKRIIELTKSGQSPEIILQELQKSANM